MSELALKPELARRIQENGYDDALPFYLDLIKPILQGQDVFAQGDFPWRYYYLSIAVLERIDCSTKGRTLGCQAMIITSTPELAWTIKGIIKQAASFAPSVRAYACRMSPVYLQEEIAELQADGHPPQVITGTPARIMRHIPSGALGTNALRIVVIDNIDEILSWGLDESLVALLRMLPCENIQLVVHSGLRTQWRAVWARVGEFMKNPVRVWDDKPHR